MNGSVSRRVTLLAALLAALTASIAGASDRQGYVAFWAEEGRFGLSVDGRPAPLRVSPDDHAGVVRAARDLQSDLERVTGARPHLALSTDEVNEATTVLIGTVGKSALIDHLADQGKINVDDLASRWESYLIQVVDEPMPGVEQALVVAGSDKRGTIFGIYDLSQQIGVSPWHYWADVPIRRRDDLYVLPGPHLSGEPAVRYRGIFINDENPALFGWVNETFGGFNHEFYETVYELILRMKGNYLWPAMWGKALYDDDPLNAPLAAEYGVVIGTTHHEPMMRAHVEWSRYGAGDWNYVTNEETLQEFWREGIRRMGSNESIVTLGMRGDGDEPMTRGTAIALLERIVADQRRILAEETGKDPSETPQIWALYKEVQDYFDQGMDVPDDVTLLFADDNWGNIRRLPRLDEERRTGGYGVYYHYDYVGGPRNYKWINTNQIERVWEQMHLAYQYGADHIWIVNVGDIKPMEFPTEFFLEYAWNPDAWPLERLPEYTRPWAERQFGESHPEEIALLLEGYTKFNARRKPELLAPDTYSLVDYREAERVVEEFNALATRASEINELLGVEFRDAYYQLVLFPILACANLNELYVTVGKNRLSAKQGRASANQLARRARELFERDAELTRIYHEDIAGGKWVHMMSQTHIGYTYWQEPPENVMPTVEEVQLAAQAEMGVGIEGSADWWPELQEGATLPEFDRFLRQTYYIDVFNRGEEPFEYSLDLGAPWLRASATGGRVADEERVYVSVDWAAAPAGRHRAPITIEGPGGALATVEAVAFNPLSSPPEEVIGFVESNGYVSIEAESFHRAVDAPPIEWKRIQNLGRASSGITAFPVTTDARPLTQASPRLEYRVHLFTPGEVTVHAYLSPTLAYNGSDGLWFAVSFDDDPPQEINMHADGAHIAENGNRPWERMVADNVKIVQSTHRIEEAGDHVLKFWMIDPGVVVQKLVIDTGGLRPSYLGPPETTAGQGTTSARFEWFEYEGRDPVFQELEASSDEFYNPILAGFYPDPSITRVGDDYYLVTSSFAYFPGIPIFHSRDLVSWTQLGHVLDRPSQLDLDGLGISRGIFAPAIRHHDGIYYVVCTLVDNGGNFVVTATDPAGPWTDPVWLPELDGIDPSLFFDDDGRAYIMNNGPPPSAPLYGGHRALWIQEFDAANLQTVGPRQVIVDGGVDITQEPIWIEAPHIFKVDGTYYLIAAEGGTGAWHSEVVFRSDDVWGPWVPYEDNPILTQRHLDSERPYPVTSAGHADFVQTQNGEWWAVFLATRPYRDDLYNTGRETFLMPVRWKDGWPIVMAGEETIPYVHRRPDLPRQVAPAVPTSGNFTVRDDFEAPSLAPYWTFIRTPREEWYDLTSSPGMLTIRARPAELHTRSQPSFVGRRQQHAWASAATKMHFVPRASGERAGIVAFQNDDYYYFLGVARENDVPVVRVERRAGENGAAAEVLSQQVLGTSDPEAIYLKIEARGDVYDFYYGLQEDNWILLEEGADGTILSTHVAGGFVGSMFGMYAYAP